MALLLLGCESMPEPSINQEPVVIVAGTPTPPHVIATPNPDAVFAQATKEAGQAQLLDLERRATELSLNQSQAQDAAVQATQDYVQRQQVDLAFQATQVSMEMAQAAATQNALAQQTKIARAATANAAAYLRHVTQTAQAQAVLDAQFRQTEQVVAALTAYPLTETPLAATQSALLVQQTIIQQ